nr:unnamed protein product [Callosobruchus analis]
MSTTEGVDEIVARTRGQIKASLTRFISYLDRHSNRQVDVLKSRLEHTEQLFKEFNRVQAALEVLDESELETEEREQFEERFFNAIAKAKQFIAQSEANNQVETRTADHGRMPINQGSGGGKGFPTIDLIKFNGDFDKWPQFRDLYITLVHNDNSIDNVRKFYYLISSLEGQASKIVESIQVTSENYNIAWQLVQERYENKQLIVKKHVRCLFELPTVSKDKYTLRNLIDDFNKSYRALQLQGESVDSWDTLLIYLITTKIDPRSLTLWEESLIHKRVTNPSLHQLLEFLSDRCKVFETTEQTVKHEKTATNVPLNSKTGISKQKSFNNHGSNEKYVKKHHSYVSTQSGQAGNVKCVFCADAHYVYRCKKLLEMSVAARAQEVAKLKLCSNCLRLGHAVSQCSSQGCRVCSAKHNTILHTDQSSESRVESNTSTDQNNVSTSGIIVNHCTQSEPQILLSTVQIDIKDSKGRWHQCRALLDNGSQSNFISKSLMTKLDLLCSKINIPVVGVGNACTNISLRTSTDIKSADDKYRNKLDFLVLEKITECLPTVAFSRNKLNIPSNIKLSDSQFNVPSEIDVLLGATIFYNILKFGTHSLGPYQPTLQNTVFGWTLSGMLNSNECRNRAQKTVSCHAVTISNDDQILQNQLEKFWQVEECPTTNSLTPDEKECERIFTTTTTRNELGHFVVELPLRNNVCDLGDTLDIAVKRLYAVERKFKKDPIFKQAYIDFMKEYEALNHMSKIDSTQKSPNSHPIYYLPHHGVMNTNSTTTKLRTVFDGSCKSTSGLSLNDVLLTGPTIQDDLFSILIRFRKHQVVLTADVEKMYRMVQIAERHRDLQRIVWRYNPDDEISHYQLNTVTYGTTASPFLAVRALTQAAVEQNHNFPQASNVILTDMYVDDLITGTSSINDTIKLKSDLANVLEPYGFKLRKWSSNESDILNTDGRNVTSTHDTHYICADETRRTLGIVWQARQDVLSYAIDIEMPSQTYTTKRVVLSIISRVFDPLGLISPIIITFKILLQRLWQQNLGWDEPLPRALLDTWQDCVRHLGSINELKITRLTFIDKVVYVELHCFSDASQAAYGACVYVKSVNNAGQSVVNLICSKSRVAPLKVLSVPCLELCGAVLATKLCDKVKLALKSDISECYYWTDSTIVLSWVVTCPSKLKVFTANRVAEIQRMTESHQWRYVPTHLNPADLVSRGVTPHELINESSLWWNGPTFLIEDSCNWPTLPILNQSVPELKQTQSFLSLQPDSLKIFHLFSSLHQIQRAVAWCFRLFTNQKLPKPQRMFGSLTTDELTRSMNFIIKLAQREMFPDEMACITKGTPISQNSRLVQLDPILDSNGLIRVGGRLKKANIPYDTKHQIILSSTHALTKLIITNEHYRHLHAGGLQLLGSLRQTYWIIHGRRTIRSILSKCIVCFRLRPTAITCKMADLPRDRENSIKWNFIAPRSPHQGGLWEAAVKRAKFHITRIIGKSVLTFEELTTLFSRVEATMNSRPLTPLSDDPSDLNALTPGHFLIGTSLLTVPQNDLTEVPENRLDHYHKIHQKCQFFWSRWSKDYLTTLQPRQKWTSDTNSPSLAIGSMVLVNDENLPPLHWRLGRVIKLHPSSDDKKRVATIRTASGDLTRAVQKLCLLPINTPSTSC